MEDNRSFMSKFSHQGRLETEIKKPGALAARPPERLLGHSSCDGKNNYLAVHPSSNPPPPARLARGFID
jgi:hypothetical protein